VTVRPSLVALMCMVPQRMHRRTVYDGRGAPASGRVTPRARASSDGERRSAPTARAAESTRRRWCPGLLCATVICNEAYST
jgi:hypothetical protein